MADFAERCLFSCEKTPQYCINSSLTCDFSPLYKITAAFLVFMRCCYNFYCGDIIAHRSDGTVGCAVVIQLISQPVFSRTFQVFLQAAGEDEPSVLHWLIVNQPIQL